MTLCSMINKFVWVVVTALIKCNFDQVEKAMAKLDTAQVRISSLEKSLAAAEAEQQCAQDNWLDLSSQHEKLRAQLASQNSEILGKGKEVRIQHSRVCVHAFTQAITPKSRRALTHVEVHRWRMRMRGLRVCARRVMLPLGKQTTSPSEFCAFRRT